MPWRFSFFVFFDIICHVKRATFYEGGMNVDNLKQLSKGEIIALIKEGKVEAADLTDSGICPTCFNRENDEVLHPEGNRPKKLA